MHNARSIEFHFEMNQEKIYSGHPHYHQYQHHHQQTYPHISSPGALQQGVTSMDQPLLHPEYYSQISVPTIASSGGSGSDCSTSVGVEAAAHNGSWRPLADAPFTSSHSSGVGPLTDVDPAAEAYPGRRATLPRLCLEATVSFRQFQKRR